MAICLEVDCLEKSLAQKLQIKIQLDNEKDLEAAERWHRGDWKCASVEGRQ